LGVSLHPIEKLTIDLSYDKRWDYGGNLDGGIIDVLYDANNKLQVGAGISCDVYDRSFFPSSSGNEDSQRYWVGGKYKLARNMRASLRIEDLETSARNDSDVQGRFVFDYDF
jgi:hypothetical protein